MQPTSLVTRRAVVRRAERRLLDLTTCEGGVVTRNECLHLLDDLNRDGRAIVRTTHDLNGKASHLPHLVALQQRIIATVAPSEVIVPSVLEKVFGARLEVLQHLGMPVVVDAHTVGAA